MDDLNKTSVSDPQEEPAKPTEGLSEKLTTTEKQRDEYLAGWQRAKADFINYKKEEMSHLSEVAKYASEDMVKELITVLDNFDLGLAALEDKGPVEKGVYMIRTQIEDVLKRRGLVKVEIKAGDKYDPSVAEASAEVEFDGPPGNVVEVIEPGYRLNERLIRPARVKISKEKTN